MASIVAAPCHAPRNRVDHCSTASPGLLGPVPRRTVDNPPGSRQWDRLLENAGAWILAAFVAVAAPHATQAATPKTDIQGRVVAVADGDTLTVLDAANEQHKVRLACIDAPEKRQDFGTQSKRSLSELVFGKAVRVIVRDQDRYGRLVGTIMLDELDVNLEQVRRGMAWVYERYCTDRAFFAAQTNAQEGRAALWQDRAPTPPWQWRRAHRAPRPSAGSASPAISPAPNPARVCKKGCPCGRNCIDCSKRCTK